MPAVDDLKSLNRLDQVVLGAGVLALIFSFFPFFGVSESASGFHVSASVNAWHSYGFLGVLLVLLATGLAAARIFAPTSIPTLPVGINLLTAALAGLGFLILLLRGFTYSAPSGPGISAGIRVTGIILLVLVLAETVAAVMGFKASGEAMPDFKAMQANKAAAGGATPPPPVYGGTPPAATYPPATATPAGDYTLDDSTPPPPSV